MSRRGEPRWEIVDVVATRTGERTYGFAVTISSPYDSPERYADGWRVLGPGGEVLAGWELLHDPAAAANQPDARPS